VWNSEAPDLAHVHVIIVGFSHGPTQPLLFEYPNGKGVAVVRSTNSINAYLVDADNVFVAKRSKPISDVPSMVAGGKPTEGGNLILSQDERDELIRREPLAERYIRSYSMGAEFINSIPRYCLWLVDCPPHELRQMPLVWKRVERVREMRLASPKEATRRKAAAPMLFDEIRGISDDHYIAIPKVSSERRDYIPIGFLTNQTVPGDMLFVIGEANAYLHLSVPQRLDACGRRAAEVRLSLFEHDGL
jgi:hypothetical protein